jgi:Ca2+-binding EF-hand superfamily protein/mono/diheme cytochrome c family protein
MIQRLLLPCSALALITTAWLAMGQESDLQARFEAFDLNHDGVISGTEMQAEAILPRLDLNGDGQLTLAEATQAMRKKKAGASSSPESQPTSPAAGDRRLFDFLDKDHDGRLTSAELPRRQWLQRLDGNGDGSVTFDEADAVVTRMKALGESLPRIPGAPDMPATEAASQEVVTRLTEAPQVLHGDELGVGRLVEDLPLGSQPLSQHLQGRQGLILSFFGATCPISGKLGPELARLEKEAEAQQLRLILICPVAGESAEDIQSFVSTHGLKSAVVHDQTSVISTALGARTTTEVFLIDAARTLQYRGAINDQYGLGYAKDEPSRTYLRDAIQAMQRGQLPEIAATSAPGCELDLKPRAAATQTDITYHRHIARLMQRHCMECHRDGGVGPFPLTTYEEVIEHAGMIRKQVERGAMPPWFAAPLPDTAHSPWMNDASLPVQDKANLLSWLASDRPRGDVAETPKPLQFPAGWSIGTPDLVIQLPQPVSIKAEGTMPYQFITVKTELTEDRWVQAYEILPSEASVVHHVIVQVHEKGSKARDREEGREGYWAAYVPGNTHHRWPEGFAKKLPAGATVSFQIHYTPNGRKVEEQLKMGLLFAKAEPRFIVHTAAVSNPRLNIPPHTADHVEVKEQTVPFDMPVMAYVAHMHLRGKSFKFEVTPPGGKTEVLLDMPHYDFNWQLRYTYATPKILPRGSKMKITAIYDNSADNPANPDPAKNVRWGPQTFDEMMIGYLEYFTPNPARS